VVGYTVLVPKRPTTSPKPRLHSWAVYYVKPAQFVGIVHDQPDEVAAIRAAIREYKVPLDGRDRLMARRWD
jgi:hypothetical protein